MKFGQLKEYNTTKTFLEKSYQKCGGETSPKLFSEKSKLSVPLDQSLVLSFTQCILYVKLRAMELY